MSIRTQVEEQGLLNPEVRDTQDPNFLQWSRGIQQPHFVSSSAEAIKGVSEGVSGAVRGVDDIIKAFAGADARGVAYKAREEETQNLQSIDQALRGNTKVASVSNLPPGVTPDTVPQEIKNIVEN